MDSAKKQHERFLLDRFLELQGISPTSVQPREAPDFLIGLEGRDVGIEVTELFIRSGKSTVGPEPKERPLLQAEEKITNRIVSKAREIYFDAGNPLLMSTIWFSDRITLDKRKGDQIAELIAHQVQSMSLQDSPEAAWRPSEDENEEHPLSEWIDTIRTQRVPEYGDAQWKDRFAQWTFAGSGLVAPLTPKRLQEVIDEKAEKIDRYKECAGTEEIWLLIVADCTLPSRMFYVATDFPRDSVSSPFAKTFYYGYPAEGVMDLTNKAKTSGRN